MRWRCSDGDGVHTSLFRRFENRSAAKSATPEAALSLGVRYSGLDSLLADVPSAATDGEKNSAELSPERCLRCAVGWLARRVAADVSSFSTGDNLRGLAFCGRGVRYVSDTDTFT